MSRGVNGCPTFQDDLDRQRFLDQLEELVDCCKLSVYAFCLMLNHYHLLCETPSGKLSRWMQQLLSRYTRGFNRRHRRTGHLWQARYKAILVQDGDYFLHCSRYIHLNPIEAGLVANPEDYPWSSYGACLDPNLAPAWLLQDKILRCFAGADHYMRFVQEGMQEKLPNPLEVAKGGIAFGDEVFVRQIRLLQRDPLRIPTSRAYSKWR